jgi:hypothetical protein
VEHGGFQEGERFVAQGQPTMRSGQPSGWYLPMDWAPRLVWKRVALGARRITSAMLPEWSGSPWLAMTYSMREGSTTSAMRRNIWSLKPHITVSTRVMWSSTMRYELNEVPRWV